MEINWHNLEIKEVFERLKSRKEGLVAEEIEIRQKKYGPNRLPPPPRLTAVQIFLNQLKDPLLLILFIGGFTSLFLREFLDGIVIFAAVVINSIIGFVQEYKAEAAIRALQRLVPIQAKVIRRGREILIGAGDIAVGDIIVLDEGDRVPADARIFEAHDLQANEAILTGESYPNEKEAAVLPVGTVLADRKNMAYGGTAIIKGRGLAVVVGIGLNTEAGKIALSLKRVKEEPTPLQSEMKKLTHFLFGLILSVTTILFVIGLIQERPFKEVFLTAVAVIVSTVPEGLPIAITIILVIGVRRILKENALIRRIIAAETLGSVSVVCMDKTGTLTQGAMRLSNIWSFDDDKIFALKIGIFCNNAALEGDLKSNDFKILGDPLEGALILAGKDLGFQKESFGKESPRLDEIPFSSERKFMATLHKISAGKNIIYIKGAPEKILEFSSKYKTKSGLKDFSDKDKNIVLEKVEYFAEKGERVIALGYKEVGIDEIKALNHDEKMLFGSAFVGLMSFSDPLRVGIGEVVRDGLRAGVRPVILTGDYLKTAVTIAREAGIKAEKENIIEAKECSEMTEERFLDCVKKINVFARVEPKDKVRIVEALKKTGAVTAMVGDGVNDAPSLKSADIGISLGTGTDVAKETADMVLLDNNFKTIISAIKQGRLIFDNIRKAVVYALSDAFCEIILLAGAIVFNMPLPFFPAQILWVNLVEDTLPNLALGFDKAEKELLKEKPRKKDESILNAEMKTLIFVVGIITDIMLFGLFYYLWKTTGDLIYARTMVFSGLAIDTLFYVFAIRTLRQPIWKRNPFSNVYLIGAVVVGFLLMVLALYLPPLQHLLRTMPLTIRDWLILIPLGIINIVLIEFVKGIFFFFRRGKTVS